MYGLPSHVGVLRSDNEEEDHMLINQLNSKEEGSAAHRPASSTGRQPGQ